MHPVETHEFLKQLSPFNRCRGRKVADLLLYMECAPFLNGEVVHLDEERIAASGNASLAIIDHDDAQVPEPPRSDLNIGWISTYGHYTRCATLEVLSAD